jgi:DNA (cytosine-5)-methyltransferase 1
MILLASLFDGIGGALLCAERCGAVPIWASEIEPFPIKVTKYHFPNVKHYGDITKINGAAVEPVDIIVGGSPCQDLSVAGLRQGMKHADFGDATGTRSGLFMEQIRIIKEMRNATGTNYPRFMVWENVPGAFSSQGGEDFRAVLEETARVADPTISIPRPPSGWANSGSILGDGFSISWRTVDAQYWGVPQRRRRIYLVADFGGQSAPEILFEREGLRGDIAEGGEKGQGIARDAKGGVTTAGGSDVTSTLFAAYGTKWNGNSGALTGDHFVLDDACENHAVPTTHFHQGSGTREGAAGDAERRVTCAEPIVLNDQGGSVMDVSHVAGTLRNQAHGHEPVICLQGNGIDRADTAGCNGKGWTEDVCYTLNTIDRPAVAYGFKLGNSGEAHSIGLQEECAPTLNAECGGNKPAVALFENHPQDSRVTGPLDVANSVVKQYGTGGGNVPFVLDRASFNQGENALYDPLIEQSEVCPTCISRGPHAVARMTAFGEYCEDGTFSTMKDRDYKDATDLVVANTVRRLTPLECERLQGYPDNYTNIPGASDSARYKALGNSFEIHCAMFAISGCVEQIRMDGAK